jgi:AraC-like DNA-binding protein
MAPLGFSAILDFSGVAIGLLLALLLWSSPRGNRAANHWLAAYVASLAFLSIGDTLEDSRWVLTLPHLAHVTDWAIFLVGPLLWMYVRRLTLHTRPSFQRWLWHTIPAGLVIAFLLPFYALPAADKLPVIAADLSERDSINSPALLLAAAQMLAYWGASLWTLRRYSRALRDRFSSLEHREFRWLSAMLVVNLLMWCCWLIGLSTRQAWAAWFDLVAVPAGLYLLAILGLRQPAVFAEREAKEWAEAEESRTSSAGSADDSQVAVVSAPVNENPPASGITTAGDAEPPRYRRSGLDRARVPKLMAALDELMAHEKPWLENNLTLPQLAERAGLSPHHLSQLLNETRSETFFDFVNTRRVAEVQRCLKDPAYRDQSLLEIALASGFNSKGAFNTAFRRHAGMTPTEFRRQASFATQ